MSSHHLSFVVLIHGIFSALHKDFLFNAYNNHSKCPPL